ncbi:hypothetical protein G6O67_004261 [Ophiocordyceps sinensis]|uniref:LYR motif-containing protein Cup1-like N-terminal domain-containing protein n=1 Tax=Ophiocordyceps sinensis TaxID=72228 RepID=A0A8H4LZC8_9HYPO|nr:hypothetical protein G6O67_004261 [Ophiocordyceps sinensis]
MPAPWHPLPSSLSPVHLYRHLLRELSYLPPAFRATIESIIHERFHRHRRYDARAKAHLSRAMTVLRTLRAANSGDQDAMQGLISKAFARSGIRRRELIFKLVKPQGPDDSQALEEVLSGSADGKQTMETDRASELSRKPKHEHLEKWDHPKLLQLLKSQKKQQGQTKNTTSWPSSSVKAVDDTQFVPKLDIWGKPPSEVLVRAKRARWWRLAADRIMPPLGRGEWDLLGRLGAGTQREAQWAIPERRQPAHALVAQQDQDASLGWDWEAHATQPTCVVEKPKSLYNQRRSGQRDPGPHSLRERSSTISPRWFRRAYNRTWQLTPTMSQDPNTLKYSLKWGHAPSRIPSARGAQLGMFEGIDERGKTKKGSAT